MAVLQKIRVKFGVLISVIIALALLSFIIDPGTLETALNSMSSKFDVGKIAGKSVSYTDYADDVERYTRLNQIITGSSVQNEQTQKQIRQAWLHHPQSLRERVERFLIQHCVYPAGRKQFNILMTRLADEVNDSRLDVSRVLNQMQKDGLLILSRGRIEVPQLERLLSVRP